MTSDFILLLNLNKIMDLYLKEGAVTSAFAGRLFCPGAKLK